MDVEKFAAKWQDSGVLYDVTDEGSVRVFFQDVRVCLSFKFFFFFGTNELHERNHATNRSPSKVRQEGHATLQT